MATEWQFLPPTLSMGGYRDETISLFDIFNPEQRAAFMSLLRLGREMKRASDEHHTIEYTWEDAAGTVVGQGIVSMNPVVANGVMKLDVICTFPTDCSLSRITLRVRETGYTCARRVKQSIHAPVGITFTFSFSVNFNVGLDDDWEVG